LVAPEPRTHGGKRIACPECHGTNVKVTTVCECRSCGHVSTNRLQDYEPNADAAASEPSPQATTDTQLACLENNQQEASERTNGGGVLAHGETAGLLDETTDKQVACRLLAQLAGDGNVIEQQRQKTAKYLPAGDTFTLAMASQHLDGTHTYGTTLQRSDGRTLALLVESDDAAGMRVLAASMRQLVETGAYATLELSPSAHHPGGGVLCLWFAELVDAAAARATLLHHAPQLAAFVEYWPHSGNGRGRRLPGGRYVRPALPAVDGKPAQPAVDEWCHVVFIEGETLTGMDAMQRVARDERTPAAWVTEQPVQLVETPANVGAVDAFPCLVISTERVLLATATRRRPAALDDTVWQGKYGATAATVWFAFVDAFAVTWFNERHRLTDTLDADAKGYARATWRDERTASVKVYADGSWRDYGNAGDGPAHGDVLDAYCLVHGKAKATVLADVARGIVQEATQALAAAAAASDGAVPAWLLDILTEAGWRQYEALRAKRGSQQPIRYRPGGVRHGI
jgi:transcription initiation factor TFIIIB Brf1 subunit/transcription initiation factor TFIIB